MPVPQFGEPASGREHKDRPAAFGIAEQDGRIALVRVEKVGSAPWLDLPGGALDPGEDEAAALVREFGEETGLAIRAGERFTRADQYFLKTDGEAVNNRAGFWTVASFAPAPQLKIEDDHTLVWLDPHEAIVRLRHEAHAWAVAAWLRWRGDIAGDR
ncbi:MAG: NUDIX domain-containing protein [Phenylobacterium sp.]|nr:NUDIX domain-containing protein [Phenylobacterium sp.]